MQEILLAIDDGRLVEGLLDQLREAIGTVGTRFLHQVPLEHLGDDTPDEVGFPADPAVAGLALQEIGAAVDRAVTPGSLARPRPSEGVRSAVAAVVDPWPDPERDPLA
jgi:hypothetical protein